jgi:hypothetical protein
VNRTADPTVRAIEDALAFATAAIDGAVPEAVAIGRHAIADDHQLFLDALASTVQLLADEAAAGDVDVSDAVRDVALGVQLAHLAERPAPERDVER